jgi:hypothetical protein
MLDGEGSVLKFLRAIRHRKSPARSRSAPRAAPSWSVLAVSLVLSGAVAYEPIHLLSETHLEEHGLETHGPSSPHAVAGAEDAAADHSSHEPHSAHDHQGGVALARHLAPSLPVPAAEARRGLLLDSALAATGRYTPAPPHEPPRPPPRTPLQPRAPPSLLSL